MKKLLLLLLFITAGIIASAQDPELPDTLMVCQTDSVQLDAGEGFVSYDWNTGDSTQKIWVDSTATYIVELVDQNGNDTTDRAYVNILNFKLLVEDREMNDTTVCFNDSINLSVHPDTLEYFWEPTGDISSSIKVSPSDSTVYTVTVTDGINTCEDSTLLRVYPRFDVEIEQFTEGCSGECAGQARAYVSGGVPPYDRFLWNGTPSLFDSIKDGLCEGENRFTLTDSVGCTLDTNFNISALPATDVVISTAPITNDDSMATVYIQNPTIEFAFTNESSTEIIDWYWQFGDGDTSNVHDPVHTYEEVKEYEGDNYTVSLTVTNAEGCDTTLFVELPVMEAQLKIPNAFTPNGDGVNDVFKIINETHESQPTIEPEFLRLELVVFNRHGRKVYENSNYLSDWEGGGLSDGTYFYVLYAHGFYRTDKYTGVITILTGTP
ncbi:MAG: gliding motility-associated C-terminal domain-containing protein [Bacteroidales bacterium]|nr:gliding motility-associated C-terminal domain-containing protein [Bacteroidales bacterium]